MIQESGEFIWLFSLIEKKIIKKILLRAANFVLSSKKLHDLLLLNKPQTQSQFVHLINLLEVSRNKELFITA